MKKYHLNDLKELHVCNAKTEESCWYKSSGHIDSAARRRVLAGNPKEPVEFWMTAAMAYQKPSKLFSMKPLEERLASLEGEKIVSPSRYAGHTVALLAEQKVEDFLKGNLRDLEASSQAEYLNSLYRAGKVTSATSLKERQALVNSLAVRFLLKRSDASIANWSETNLFETKQNDTADLVVFSQKHGIDNSAVILMDLKSRDKSKTSQPPNIISARKLESLSKIVLTDESRYLRSEFSLVYVDIPWEKKNNELVLSKPEIVQLFKTDPKNLYINWTAGKQIQVNLHELDQSFAGTTVEWFKKFRQHYTDSRKQFTHRLLLEQNELEDFNKSLAELSK